MKISMKEVLSSCVTNEQTSTRNFHGKGGGGREMQKSYGKRRKNKHDKSWARGVFTLWFPVVIMLTSHQMESANSSNSPRVIIQGVATSRHMGGWPFDCKLPRVNHDSVDDIQRSPLSC